MNIRDLSYIQAVNKFGHFGSAAKACHVSQPALSSQIKKLELELGVKLFERDNRSVRLTPVGEKIVTLAEDVLAIIDQIHMTAETARDPLSGQFRLGIIPTIAPYLVPHFVRQVHETFPKVDLQFQEDITERHNQALINGKLDAAILATPPDNPKLDVIRLYDEPFWVVFPTLHALHLIDGICIENLPVEELLLLTEGHCFRDQALDVCKLDESPKMRTVRATSLATLVNMVAAGLGVTLVPAMALTEGMVSVQGVRTEKLKDPNAYRRVYLTFRKSYPRRELLIAISNVICKNLPESVNHIA